MTAGAYKCDKGEGVCVEATPGALAVLRAVADSFDVQS